VQIRFLSLFLAAPLWANVCTPLTVPANGPFPAVPANGIDGVSWSVARVMWTSDQQPGPATRQRIQYEPDATFRTNGGIYTHITAQTAQTTTSSKQIQSGILSNLLPNTLYHVLAQSDQGGAWCTANDQTFTTLPKPPKPINAQLPTPVDTTRPPMNGTHWVYGSNCGNTTSNPRGTWAATNAYAAHDSVTLSAYPTVIYYAKEANINQPPNALFSPYWTPLVTLNLQDCFNKMNTANGDDLGLPPGTHPITGATLHNSENAVSVTCSTSNSYCSQTGTAPASGTQVIFGSELYGSAPSPINPGVPYKVINSSGSQFQLSYDGATAITLLDAGSKVQYLPWPITQPKSVIHSTAPANLLPPPGVRLGADAIAQYYPNMPNLQAEEPNALGNTGNGIITLTPLTVNIEFENLRWSVDPAITAANPIDPVAFPYPLVTGHYSNSGIVFDQIALDPGPSPNRIVGAYLKGSHISIVNSYLAIDFWQPHYYAAGPWTATSPTTVKLPATTVSYVGSDGKRVSCSSVGGTISIRGSASGRIVVWVDANCTWEAQLTNGLTAASTVPGMIISNAPTPAYPLSVFTTPTGYTLNQHASIPIYTLTVSAGSIANDLANFPQNVGTTANPASNESSAGVQMSGYGPYKFDNNYISGGGVAGFFFTEDLLANGGNPCNSSHPCAIQTVVGNLAVTRNTITTNADRFFYNSPHWDGGNRYWRNFNENKAGRYTVTDGNIFGPYSGQVGEGECSLHQDYTTKDIQVGNYPSYSDVSDWIFANNTCLKTAGGIYTNWAIHGYVYYSYPARNYIVRNNLFIDINPYMQTAASQPFGSKVMPDPTNPSYCGHGTLVTWIPGENFLFDHNTVRGQGGCQPLVVNYTFDFPSGGFTNNILNFVVDPAFGNSLKKGTHFEPMGYLGGVCAANTNGGMPLLNCIKNFDWAGNVMLATWKNSYPKTLSEFSARDIAKAKSYFPPANWPEANTLARRRDQIGWSNPTALDMRLKRSSPYASANQSALTSPTTDGKDAGADIDQLLQHQGAVQKVKVLAKTSTSATLSFYAPDSFACGVDWGTKPFYKGSGTWTRVAGAVGSPDVRAQRVTLSGLPVHSLIYYRLNCAVQQPTDSIQLP